MNEMQKLYISQMSDIVIDIISQGKYTATFDLIGRLNHLSVYVWDIKKDTVLLVRLIDFSENIEKNRAYSIETIKLLSVFLE